VLILISAVQWERWRIGDLKTNMEFALKQARPDQDIVANLLLSLFSSLFLSLPLSRPLSLPLPDLLAPCECAYAASVTTQHPMELGQELPPLV
jgi:hypothetical protein